MNPNHLEVLRVFTRRADELVEDTTIKTADSNQIVVEWEAGEAANDSYSGVGDVKIEAIVTDLTAGGQPFAPLTFGDKTDGEHRAAKYERVFAIPAGLVGGTTYEVTAVVTAPHPPTGPPIVGSFDKWLFYAI